MPLFRGLWKGSTKNHTNQKHLVSFRVTSWTFPIAPDGRKGFQDFNPRMINRWAIPGRPLRKLDLALPKSGKPAGQSESIPIRSPIALVGPRSFSGSTRLSPTGKRSAPPDIPRCDKAAAHRAGGDGRQKPTRRRTHKTA